ncbi:WXG100 family type VII secretion target [Metabacillus idriensis]|uniref:WXG100 family type VII secretion target n=1 Tax=Metabacillus idriensis TaxID=324768 RepID=UPI00174CFCCA|nr:WXG100 family type VII secretion target [Metabacillus idriensis]
MNSEHVRAMARVFQEASDTVKFNETNLMQAVDDKAATWSGKSRDKFDSALEEARVLFQRHSDNLYDISRELQSAADSVDRVREEIERQEELERLERMMRLKNLDKY